MFLDGPLAVAVSTAVAGEKVLEFKLVTKPLDVKVTEVANVEGQTVASGKVFGVAVFKDGRIGVKEFVNTSDLLKGSGPFFGYSTYTFEDGSITARYTGSVKDGNPGFGIVGEPTSSSRLRDHFQSAHRCAGPCVDELNV